MVNVLLVEDEKLAGDYLKKLLLESSYDVNIIGRADSVKNSIKWILKNPPPDLIFMDIDLGDGLCFEIFEVVDPKAPVIFTTAYDEFAIQAFKVNSIDYLLKPVDRKELDGAFEKYTRISDSYSGGAQAKIENLGRMVSKGYKERFIIKIGEHLKTLPVNDIKFFFSREKASYAVNNEGRNYLIDYTLDRLEEMMDPQRFIRINRQYLISYDAIRDIITYSNSRLKVVLQGSDDSDIIVSRDRVNNFKSWLDR